VPRLRGCLSLVEGGRGDPAARHPVRHRRAGAGVAQASLALPSN
jgi:hypothetical protein